MKQLAKAVLAVMEEVKGIDKNLTVGTGRSAYKGVSDQDVKKIIGTAMQKNGLCILPIGVEPKVQVDRWEEPDYQGTIRSKQSVFTEVQTRYLLLHESGESLEIQGYGHGVDPQDKGAGKATTYALKYALLYAFMIPTGQIDDADSTHSNETNTPAKPVANVPFLQRPKIETERFKNALQKIKDGEYTGQALRATFDLTKTQEKELQKIESNEQ